MKNVCIFGDSITWGAGLSLRESWADLVRNNLSKSDTALSVYSLGIDAENTRGLLKRFSNEAKVRKPEIIIFAVGTNDSIFWLPDTVDVSISEYTKNIQELIYKARKHTNNIIFIGLAKGADTLTVPLPASSTGKCFTKEKIAIYNKALKKIVLENNLSFINIAEYLADCDFLDGLHPNLEGHNKIYNAVKPILTKALV